MAHILTHACGSNPYRFQQKEQEEEEQMEPLVRWDESQWVGLADSFRLLRSLMLRRDADINYLGPDDALPDAQTIDKDRAESPLFKKKLKTFMDIIELQRILAPIRYALELQTRKITPAEKIRKRNLITLWDTICKLDSDSAVKEALLPFFEIDKNPTPDDAKQLPGLRSLTEIASILQAPPFDLGYIQNAVENLMHRFNQVISGNHDCALIQARYAIPEDSTLAQTLSPRMDKRVAAYSARKHKLAARLEKQKLDELRRGRAALNAGHGEDPLDAALEAAKEAKAADDGEGEDDSKKEKKKRKRMPRLTIVDEMEDSDADEENSESGPKLSKVPKRKRKSSVDPTSRAAHMIPPDEGIFGEDGRVLKRLRWTDEEKMCVKEGVKNHGVGKWKEIKMEYGAILRNRTPVQIKDCWRTMTKNQEV